MFFKCNLKCLLKIFGFIFSIYLIIVLITLSILLFFYEEESLKETKSVNKSKEWSDSCFFESEYCFNIHRCINFNENKLKVYIYDKYYGEFSYEFKEFIETILNSDFYESNPKQACLFIPLVDLTNEFNLIDKKYQIEKFITSLRYWSNGKNHLLFNMISIGSKLNLEYESALLTGSSFESNTQRNGFDLSVPMFNHLTYRIKPIHILRNKRKFKIVATQLNLNLKIQNLIIFDSCSSESYFKRCLNGTIYSFPQLIEDSLFCLTILDEALSSNKIFSLMNLYDSIKFNCIPIIASDEWILPFSEFLDWNSFSIQIRLNDLKYLNQIIESLNSSRLDSMLNNLKRVYENHFSSINKITLSILDYLQMKIFTFSNQSYFVLK